MAYLVPLFILFLSAVVFSSRRKAKSDGPRSSDASKVLLNMPVPPSGFISGLLRKVATKTGLIALFTVITPRRGRIAARTVKSNPEITEILELFRDIAAHPDNVGVAVQMLNEHGSPLGWPMQYASEYYLDGRQQRHEEQDDVWSQFIQGVILFEGKGSPAEAEPLLRRAAEKGFLPACAILGDLYLSQKQWDKALQTVIHASEAGYPPAIYSHAYYVYLSTLGKFFQHRAMAEAFRLFSAAADSGYPPAMAVVGKMYLDGYGAAVMPDASSALYYLEGAFKAGETGCAPLLHRARAAVGEQLLSRG